MRLDRVRRLPVAWIVVLLLPFAACSGTDDGRIGSAEAAGVLGRSGAAPSDAAAATEEWRKATAAFRTGFFTGMSEQDLRDFADSNCRALEIPGQEDRPSWSEWVFAAEFNLRAQELISDNENVDSVAFDLELAMVLLGCGALVDSLDP